MFFNSLQFACFLPIVFILYWFIAKNNLKFQNLILLISSYFFYGCWDYRFLLLLLFSTFLDYFSGIKIHKANSASYKKIWLLLSIIINLGFLSVFKYYNFFIESFANAISLLGFKINIITLKVILPVGISFYTFHGLSYILDIYYERIKPHVNFVEYAVFVSFFPLLVAGPIERATHLLPQISKRRIFDYAYASNGLRQILWGLFKKVVIADNCAEYANVIFNNTNHQSGSTLFLGAIFFSFQIYCDFSGYSDIALGTAKLFGIDLLRNFAFPYFSRDIAEFWRRWHISLSSWFKDYVYIPLGGSKGNLRNKIRNTFIIFLLSGFWHGANWTFIFWGALNALYFLPLLLFNKNRSNMEIVARDSVFPNVKEIIQMLLTFTLVTLAWIFFRSENINAAFKYISGIFNPSLFTIPAIRPSLVISLLFIFIITEWFGRRDQYAIEKLGINIPRPIRWSLYYSLIALIYIFSGSQHQFIYFQF